MRNRHATDESLLLLANEKLNKAATSAIQRHLERCASCRERYAEAQEVRGLWVQLSEEGRLKTASQQAAFRSNTPTYAFPWLPIAGGAVACIVMLVLLFSPGVIPAARATDLLSHAVQNQKRTSTLSGFSLEAGGVFCARGRRDGQLISQSTSSACVQAAERYARSPWGNARPLSAQVYLGWHKALARRLDSVSKQDTYWKIQTTTTEGLIREANLTLRTADYHPVALDLRFDDDTNLSIHEEAETPAAEVAAAEPDHPHFDYSAHVDNPSDLLEAAAWEILVNLKADTGWEANVLRDGSQVLVKASVPDAARAETLRGAFASLNRVEVDVHNYQDGPANPDFLAQRTLNGDAPPLAHEWLDEHFTDAEARSKFTNSAVALSKVVLGRSFIVSELRQRTRALQQCTCATDMAKVLAHEESLLGIAQANLASTVAPLAGNPVRTPAKPLTYDEARKIDTALEVLLAASSSQNPLSFDENLALVRKLQ